MDSAKVEFEVADVQSQAVNAKFVSELAELQLALVGGGAGDVLF